jgi:hypothetical protein
LPAFPSSKSANRTSDETTVVGVAVAVGVNVDVPPATVVNVCVAVFAAVVVVFVFVGVFAMTVVRVGVADDTTVVAVLTGVTVSAEDTPVKLCFLLHDTEITAKTIITGIKTSTIERNFLNI